MWLGETKSNILHSDHAIKTLRSTQETHGRSDKSNILSSLIGERTYKPSLREGSSHMFCVYS